MIPTQTSMNAKSVPMFVRSTISSMLAKALTTPTSTPVRIVETWGVPKRRVNAREDRRQKPVARHREEDARLSELEDQEHRRLRDDRPERDDADRPARHARRTPSRRRAPRRARDGSRRTSAGYGTRPEKTAATTT